jgi:hypothetical protein
LKDGRKNGDPEMTMALDKGENPVSSKLKTGILGVYWASGACCA